MTTPWMTTTLPTIELSRQAAVSRTTRRPTLGVTR
jgi:hypothetical protein